MSAVTRHALPLDPDERDRLAAVLSHWSYDPPDGPERQVFLAVVALLWHAVGWPGEVVRLPVAPAVSDLAAILAGDEVGNLDTGEVLGPLPDRVRAFWRVVAAVTGGEPGELVVEEVEG